MGLILGLILGLNLGLILCQILCSILGLILVLIPGLILGLILSWINLQLYMLVTSISPADAGNHFTQYDFTILEFIEKKTLRAILSDCHYSDVINSLLNAFRLKKN